MKRSIVAAGTLAAVVIGASGASSALGAAGPPGFPAPPNGGAVEALTARGMSLEAAQRAIAVQGRLERSGVAEAVEAALGKSYGGEWFDPDAAQLHVGVAASGPHRAAEAAIAKAGLADDVRLTPVVSSWATLQAAHRRWDRRLRRLFAREQVKTGLSAQLNAVRITLGSSVPEAERLAIEQAASQASVRTIVTTAREPTVGGVPAEAKTECGAFVTEAAYCNKTITSGVTILDEAKKPECTAGPLAIPEANPKETYLLTAGHCIEKEKESWSSEYIKAGELHEIGKVGTFVWAFGGDYAEIPIENEAWKEPGNTPVFAVTAQWKPNEKRSYGVIREGKVAEKMATCHDGQRSGGSCGTIINPETTVIYSGVEVSKLVEVEGETLKIKKGDSGGPFFFEEANKEVLMQGITVAVSKERETLGWFEPIRPVLEALKLELLSSVNEVRGVKLSSETCTGGKNLDFCWESKEKGTELKEIVGEEEFLLVSSKMKLTSVLGGEKIEIECTGTTALEPLILQPEPLAKNGEVNVALEFTGCALLGVLGEKCKVPTARSTTTLVGSPKAITEISFKPKTGTIIMEIPFEEKAKCPATVKGTRLLTGTQVAKWPESIKEDLAVHLLEFGKSELLLGESEATLEASYEVSMDHESFWDMSSEA